MKDNEQIRNKEEIENEQLKKYILKNVKFSLQPNRDSESKTFRQVYLQLLVCDGHNAYQEAILIQPALENLLMKIKWQKEKTEKK